MTALRRHIASFLLCLVPAFGFYEVSVGSVLDYESPKFTRALLISEVDSYIYRYSKGRSRLSGELIVDVCLARDMDICLALAQGHLESHFGTEGKGEKMNSPWNAGKKRYEHPDSAVVPYVDLVTGKYLVKGRTVDDILTSFTTPGGKRYAEGLDYERRLRHRYNKVVANTDVKKLQEKLSGKG